MIQKREYKPTFYDTSANGCAKSQESSRERGLEEMVKNKTEQGIYWEKGVWRNTSWPFHNVL